MHSILLERVTCGKPGNGHQQPLDLSARCRGNSPTLYGKTWFRDLDSNQDTQLQRLLSYRLDDPGMGRRNCSRGMQACTGAPMGGLKVEARVAGRGARDVCLG